MARAMLMCQSMEPMSLVIFSLLVVPVTGIGLALLGAVLDRIPRRIAALTARAGHRLPRQMG